MGAWQPGKATLRITGFRSMTLRLLMATMAALSYSAGAAPKLSALVIDGMNNHGKTAWRRRAVPVLEPGNGKTKTGRLWTYVRDDRPAGSEAAPAVWFAYSPRSEEHTSELQS